MPKFSIIIPAFENVALLSRAMESVMTQTEQDWEIIVCDDSDSNEVNDYVTQIDDPRIIYQKHGRGKSAAENWNFGLRAAKGEYMLMIHHDESLKESCHLERISEMFQQGADVVVTNIEIEQVGKLSGGRPDWLKRMSLRKPALLMLCNTIGPTACLAFRKQRLQLFDDRLQWLVDAEWYYRMLKDSTIAFLENLKVYSYHGHEGQLTQNMKIIETFKSDKAIIDEVYRKNADVRKMTSLYGTLILGTKKLLGKI